MRKTGLFAVLAMPALLALTAPTSAEAGCFRVRYGFGYSSDYEQARQRAREQWVWVVANHVSDLASDTAYARNVTQTCNYQFWRRQYSCRYGALPCTS